MSICFVDKARELFAQVEGVEILMSKAKEIYDRNNEHWNDIIPFACGCIQNIIIESGILK